LLSTAKYPLDINHLFIFSQGWEIELSDISTLPSLEQKKLASGLTIQANRHLT
jgi:hypothetical protein